MKNIYIVFFFLSVVGFSQQNVKDKLWLKDFERVQKVSSKSDKPILMYFTGSDWCMPCIMLSEDFFDSEKFKKYKNSFVFIKVDIPRNRDLLTKKQHIQNSRLLKTYNKDKVFPLVTILNAKGKVLDDISGYNSLRDPKYYFELLEKYN